MVKKEGIFLLFVLIVAFGMISFSFASVDLLEQNLSTDYSAGDSLKGNFTLDVEDEDPEALITSNFDGNISLIDLLGKNDFREGQDYNCSTPNCVEGYDRDGGEINSVDLVLGAKKIIGFEILGTDEEVSIESLNISFNGETGASCSRGLLVNFLGENDFRIQNNEGSGNFCGEKDYGCFEESNVVGTAEIDANQYCEKIEFTTSPSYEIGAKIINSTNGKTSTLKMEVYNSEWDAYDNGIGRCDLEIQEENEELLSCVVNVSVIETEDHYVCISNPGEGNYNINLDIGGNECGTSNQGADDDELDRDFEIFARAMEFSSGDVNAHEGLVLEGDSLLEHVEDYIEETYDSVCESGCIIPIELSGESQTVDLEDVEIVYDDGSGTNIVLSKIYNVKNEQPLVSFDNLTFDISEANFSIPFGSEEKRLELFLDGESFLDIGINISSTFDFDISPKFAFIGLDTEFQVIYHKNISSVSWDFGDGSALLDDDKFTTHKYIEEGSYVVNVTIQSDNETSTKSFNVVAGEPEESAERLIEEYESRIANVSKSISGFESWIQEGIEREISLDSLESSLEKAKEDFNSSSSDEDYIAIINELVNLGVPQNVSIKKSGSFPLVIGLNSIDVGISEEIAGVDITDNEELKDNLIDWLNNHYEGTIETEQIVQRLDSGVENVLAAFKITVTEKQTSNRGASYLIIDQPLSSLVFKGSYDVNSAGDASYILIDSNPKTIEFYLPGIGGADAEDLRAYISPESLEGFGEGVLLGTRDDAFPWGIFSIGLAILVVLVLIIYIALQEWYKRHYEAHLFKNPDDLYNLINFIFNSRKTGLKDAEIKKKLRTRSWTPEQLTYAFNKLDGKRTGMWEIPLFKGKERKKLQEELEKRQKKPVNLSGRNFINRPRFRKPRKW